MSDFWFKNLSPFSADLRITFIPHRFPAGITKEAFLFSLKIATVDIEIKHTKVLNPSSIQPVWFSVNNH